MKRIIIKAAQVFACILAVTPVCHAADTSPIITTDISGSDLAFFMGTARESALIARLSDLAKTHAVTPEIQTLAAAISKEQSDVVARLKSLAARKSVPLPAEPDGAGRKQLQTLAAISGPRFDKTYLNALSDAQNALDSSLGAGATSTDKDIMALAQAGQGMLKSERSQLRKLGL
jgi:predicted outer membrane protein